jgi:tetratricopeptide (TPR) repeat protein
MAPALAQKTPFRHPWLDRLIVAPEEELRALIGGYAEIAPFERAEPSDAAASLLFGISEDDPARTAFDHGCGKLLENLRAALLEADEKRYAQFALMIDRLFAVVRRTTPPNTVRTLHERYARWFGVFETAIFDRGLDLRREYWRSLALTQDMAGDNLRPRRLMALWLDICAESGPLGRYDESYLDVGLIGLDGLPLGAEYNSNEEAVCHGLARWAVRQQPNQKSFFARWREIESAYPRAPTYWPPLVADVIASIEESLGRGSTFPAVAWWRDELELPKLRKGKPAPPSDRKRVVYPPPREAHEIILKDVATNIQSLKPRITKLINGHRRYADATGDVFYLVRTACNVGMRLLKTSPREGTERGEIAARLAREALEYQPTNDFAWALWRDGLAAQGALAAAETIGWEALRRFPERPHRWTQLATLLAERLDRPEEARRLLSQTIGMFPENPIAPTQLATVLADFLDHPDEAVAVLRKAMKDVPQNPHTYTQLATLLSDRFGDRAGAIEILVGFLANEPGNAVALDLLRKARAGGRLGKKVVASPGEPREVRDEADFTVDLPSARARRALFIVESADAGEVDSALKEVRAVLAEDRHLAYARYVAERVGVNTNVSGGRLDTAFAFAFDRAARAGSADALRALLTQMDGINSFIARAGITLISGQSTIEVPSAANEIDVSAFSHRFSVLAGEIGPALKYSGGDRQPFLRLLSDFAASELSSELAA